MNGLIFVNFPCKISIMLRIHLITALRNLKRNIVISFINLIGLSLGLATVLVAGLYIKHDLEADKFHEDAASIFRTSVKIRDFYMTGTPYLFGEALKQDVPSVTDVLRTTDLELMVSINENNYKHQVLFADANFLTFFTFPLAEGNRQQALNGLKQVVISHEIKQKYFGSEPALGSVIRIELDNVMTDFEVSGVALPTPNYSSMYFDFVIPLENRLVNNESLKNDPDRFFFTTFVKAKNGNIKAVEDALPGIIAKHMPADAGEAPKGFVFHSYLKHHLDEGFSGGGMRQGKSGKSLTVFGGIAGVILLLACFNFMNLTNAQSSRRSLEVGIKKVVGAIRPQLIKQFLIESLALTFIASILALGFAELGTLAFKDLLQSDISVFDRNNGDIFLALLVVTAFTGLVAGIYPAFVISGVNALKTFKKTFRIGGSNFVTRTVLGLQFTLSIVLIASAIIMWKQQNYLMQKDLGYNEEQVLVVKINQRDTASASFLKNEIAKLPDVIRVSKTSSSFTGGSSVVHHRMPNNEGAFLYMMSVDHDFIPAMEMQLVQGAGFKEEHAAREDHIMVNEALVKKLGLQDSLGMRLGGAIGSIDHPTIVGVIKDFHHSTLKHGIQPLLLLNNARMHETFLLVRLAPGKLISGLENVQALVEKTNPDSIFEFSFLDENVANQYQEEIRWSSIITLATAMAIFLSVLGLLGLAMFTAEQRKKEIGIRKVLGATMPQLITLLSKGYVMLIGIAFAIAIPASYYLMKEYWLNNFAYKTEPGAGVYVVALLIVVLIVVVSIGSLTFRAALQNPADTLKEE